jgi:translocator protein
MTPGREDAALRSLRTWLGLAGWLLVSFAAAWFGRQFTASDWYQTLERPAWAPPPWLFGPVWGVLYLLIAVAAWLVWKRHGFAGARTALALFLVQHVFNAAWSWVFFGLREPGWALAEIVALWALIVATIAAFWPKHRLAAVLLVPYLLWVTFAAALNFEIWRLN